MKTEIKYLANFIIVISIYFTGCVGSPTSPTSDIENNNKGNVVISSPTSGDSIGYDKTIIKYKVNPVVSSKYVELYVNGEYISTHFSNDSSSTLELNFTQSKMGSKISYFLKYYDTNGTSAASDTMKNLLITVSKTKPEKPYDIKIIIFKGVSSNSANISWKDKTVLGETNYEVWRSEGFTGDYKKIFGPLPPGTFNVNDDNILPSVIYYYKVRGQNKAGYSEFSSSVNTAGAGSSSNFPPPTGLTGVALSSTVVKLVWQDNSNNENLFKIERNPNLSAWSKFETIATVANNVTTFTDNTGGLKGGREYLYRIKAYSNSDSSWSNVASVVTPL